MMRNFQPSIVFLIGLLFSAVAQAADSPSTKSFTYKKTRQTDLEMVVHFPPDWRETDKRPAIVFFFGGGWTNGRIEQFESQAAHLAGRGMVAARADYRVKSRHGVGPRECVEDAKSAVRWLRQNAGRLGIDPDRIVAAGGSAGGHIAACTALTPGLDAEGEDTSISSQPNALVLLNPVLRFQGIPSLMERIGNDETLGEAISPTLHLKRDSPPTILFFGTADRLKILGDEFMEKSGEMGYRAEMFTVEGEPHGFFNRSPWRERTMQRMDDFLVSLGYLEKPSMPGKAEPATFRIEAKEADRIETKIKGDSAVFDIFSPRGIGRATIISTEGKWPATVVLRLHLHGLESLTVSNGKARLAGSVSSHGGNPQRLVLTEGEKEKKLEPENGILIFDAAGKPIEGLPEKAGYFEIRVPKALLDDPSKNLVVEWIDFYRE